MEEQDWWQIPSKSLGKGRKKREKKDCFSLLFGPRLRGEEIGSEGSYLLFGKPSSPTHSWMFNVLLSAVENRDFHTARCRELNVFSCKHCILHLFSYILAN